jgi:CRP/FNR family cyclic AMP-dependent transcriptional regulator
MKRVLFFLGYLSDIDIEWLIKNGNKQSLENKEKLIKRQESVDYLYIVLSGQFDIINSEGKIIANIGNGEVVGEMSFIESRLPDVDVVSNNKSSVFLIERDLIIKRMDENKEFKANFYYSIALFLSNRLRKTTAQMGYGNEDESDSLDINVLDNISQAGSRFSEVLKKFNDV